jgi:MATE family multidrug resistance protein
MLTVERTKTLSKLAFPIAIALSSTLIMTLIDLAMVGKLGNDATAGLGLSVFTYNMVVAFASGLVPAVQGLVARRRGQCSGEPETLPLSGGLWVALLLGMMLAIVCYLLAPFFFSHVSSDPDVTSISIPFLRVLCVGIIGVGMNGAFSGFWAGREKPNVYMLIVLFMTCLNTVGDYAFIFGHFGFPALGATGAALSTTLSVYAGVIVNLVLLYPYFQKDGLPSATPQRSVLASIFKLALPASVMQFFFWAGYLAFLWLVGRVGTEELAAANVLIRIAMLLTILAIALGSGAATLVSRTLGEGDLAGSAQWGWDAGKLGVIAISLMSLPFFLFPSLFLSFFLTDPHTISMAIIPLRIVAATSGIGSLVYILMYVLYSVGEGNRVVAVSFSTQWIFYLPAVWFVGPHLHYGLLPIWIVQSAYGSLITVLITAIWADGRWKTIKI